MYCTTEWIIKDKKDKNKSVTDRLLELRGITDKDAKYEFMHPLETQLIHPNAFCDMQKAVDRIVKAITAKEKILIYGDFDADGVTSTSVLLKTLAYLNAVVDYYIPDRDTEGHGMNSKTLVKLLAEKKPQLIITVDNGISNFDEVKFLNSFKRDVIITDHHEAPDELPQAYAIINPKSMDALDEKLTTKQIEYLTSLAGVGVAFKLAQALLERYNKLEFSYELLPFVAVGTVADIVPLIGENRYYVTKGAELITLGKHYGLKRMLDVAGVNLEEPLTAEQIGFTIAPRINASGRLDNVDNAIKVMTSDNKQEIEIAITALENFNRLRQEMCSQVFNEADELWQSTGMKDNAIVLCNADWHIGIIGIVASKFVEKYYKPAFIMTYSSENKLFRCSARGIKELNIYEILSNISEYLDGFGGHQLAGGFSFSEEKISFEAIKKALNKTVDEMLDGKQLNPSIDIDMEIELDDLDISLIDEISKLEPFGASNPSPVFVLKDLTLKQKKLMGATKEHLKLIVDTPYGQKDCVWWSRGDIPLINGDKFDVAFAPKLNIFNGTTDIQLIIKDIHSEVLKEEKFDKVKVYDHRKKTNIFAQVNDYIKTSKLGISVFVEDKQIAETLKPYEYITKCSVNRNNLCKNDVLMFFDYPSSDDLYDKIKQSVCAKALHYMYYPDLAQNENEIIKNCASMIRYSCNKQDGNFVLERAAAALGLTEEIAEVLVELYAELGMIRIIERDEGAIKIAFVGNCDISKISSSVKYEEFIELLNSVKEYKSNFMKCTL
ncbi:MAG: single-stranded-DNA-specific exonuclease RecJ [bacterium]|nr:single-stranded-DNA-specific exonuclease RecJ [bacterium]